MITEESMTLVSNAKEVSNKSKVHSEKLDHKNTVWLHPEYITIVLALVPRKK